MTIPTQRAMPLPLQQQTQHTSVMAQIQVCKLTENKSAKRFFVRRFYTVPSFMRDSNVTVI